MGIEKKVKKLKEIFKECAESEKIYQKIIEFGTKLDPFNPEDEVEKNRVPGCQSTLYLTCEKREGLLYFSATADALISKGLAALLLYVYNGESPNTLLTVPPDFLQELKIDVSLSPNRANGLYHIHLKMKQLALLQIP